MQDTGLIYNFLHYMYNTVNTEISSADSVESSRKIREGKACVGNGYIKLKQTQFGTILIKLIRL